MFKVSVVIPAYNESDKIEELLDSLYLNAIKMPDETIIIDANSTDNTLEIIYRWKANYPNYNIKIVECKEVTYPGRARNIGVKNSSGEYVAFIDSGMVAQEDWLYKMTKEIDEEIDVIWGNSKNLPKNEWEYSFGILADSSAGEYINGKTRTVPSSCIKKTTFLNKIDGFREDLRAAEDKLYFRKINQLNLKEKFIKDAYVFYSGYPTNCMDIIKKWSVYTQNDVKANTYKRKFILSIGQLIVYLFGFIVSLLISKNIIISLLTLLILHLLRILLDTRSSIVKVKSVKQIIYIFIISICTDIGRTSGIIKGFYKLKK